MPPPIGLARVFDMTAEELVEPDDSHGSKPKATALRRRRTSDTRDVPIVGFAIANPNEDGYFDDMGFPAGAGEGYVEWPTRDANAFALIVKGDSMQPRIRPTQMIVVEPSAAVLPGDEVLVQTSAGRKMVKELLYKRGDDVTLGSINQAYPQITIAGQEIKSMSLVKIVPRGTRTKEQAP
jgi:phage repressor protein C with HTH and peptisase S24 domain